MSIAIVTGASSGIGREFVRRLAQEAGLTEIWAVARRRNLLEELAQSVSLPVRPVELDLKQEESFAQLARLLEEEKPRVSLLVNNAGFAKMGRFSDLTPEQVTGMIDLNCKAAARLSLLTLPYMSRGSRIIDICSAGAFQPLPGMGIYGATKAFLLSFSRALGRELKPRGIGVTAVCPDWVNTEFISVAQDTQDPGVIQRFPFMISPQKVVDQALKDSRKGRPVSTPGPARLHRVAAKLLPHGLLMAGWGRIAEK